MKRHAEFMERLQHMFAGFDDIEKRLTMNIFLLEPSLRNMEKMCPEVWRAAALRSRRRAEMLDTDNARTGVCGLCGSLHPGSGGTQSGWCRQCQYG